MIQRPHLEVLPAYWGIETVRTKNLRFSGILDLEVLPAYWGIETFRKKSKRLLISKTIWKYYPPTGVLKQKIFIVLPPFCS